MTGCKWHPVFCGRIEMQILCKKRVHASRSCRKLTVARISWDMFDLKPCNPTYKRVLASVNMKNTLCYFGKKEVKILAPL